MITLNMENGKEVVISWIAIAVEFVKSFIKHLTRAATMLVTCTVLSLLFVALITQGLALSSSILAAVSAPAVVSFVVSVALLQYLKEKGVF